MNKGVTTKAPPIVIAPRKLSLSGVSHLYSGDMRQPVNLNELNPLIVRMNQGIQCVLDPIHTRMLLYIGVYL